MAETITVIAQMKGIRMIGLDRIIARHLHALREREVELSRTARLLKVFFGIVRKSSIAQQCHCASVSVC